MARFVTGDVVIIPFPFSDLSETKRRTALVIASLPGDDIVVCQITTRGTRDRYMVSLDQDDFESGGIREPSHIRPNRLFTADSSIVVGRAGVVKDQKVKRVVASVIDLIESGSRPRR